MTKEKILVVDDDVDSRSLFCAALGDRYDVVAIESWAGVGEHTTKSRFDLILIDVNMPVIGGEQVASILLRNLPQDDARPVRIVLTSAMDEGDLRRKAKAVGAFGYLTKAFGPELQLRVAELLRRS